MDFILPHFRGWLVWRENFLFGGPDFSVIFRRRKEAHSAPVLALGKGPPFPGPFRGLFWGPFLDISGHFWTFSTFLDFLDFSGLFHFSGLFWTFCTFCTLLDFSGLSGLSGLSGRFCTFSALFWTFSGHF